MNQRDVSKWMILQNESNLCYEASSDVWQTLVQANDGPNDLGRVGVHVVVRPVQLHRGTRLQHLHDGRPLLPRLLVAAAAHAARGRQAAPRRRERDAGYLLNRRLLLREPLVVVLRLLTLLPERVLQPHLLQLQTDFLGHRVMGRRARVQRGLLSSDNRIWTQPLILTIFLSKKIR